MKSFYENPVDCFEKLLRQVELLNKPANYLVKTLSAEHVRSFRITPCRSIFPGDNLSVMIGFMSFKLKNLWKYEFLELLSVSHFPPELTVGKFRQNYSHFS